MNSHPTYSLVVPIFNEEAVLPLFFDRVDGVLERLDGPTEVILIDDGSRDESVRLIEAKIEKDPRYRLATLSRNFGQQIAITAGLELARGSAVIIMDADLQDPPEVVLALVDQWKAGFHVVCARRASRPGDSRSKILPAALFYRLIGSLAQVDIPPNVGDFRLVDRKVVDVIRQMPERDRFVRGLFSWAGFRQTYVSFDRPARAAGGTKYTFVKLVRVAANALISFSDVPLQFALWFGIAVSAAALLFGLFVIVHWFLSANELPGWSSTVFITAFLGGTNMLMTGIMGLYVGRIYTEAKRRPLYVIDRMVGIGDTSSQPVHRDARAQLEALETKLQGGSPIRKAS